MWTGRPGRIRAWIVSLAFAAWLANFIAPIAGLPSEPGLGVAFMGVMGAALAMPVWEKFAEHDRDHNGVRELPSRRRRRQEDDGDEADNG